VKKKKTMNERMTDDEVVASKPMKTAENGKMYGDGVWKISRSGALCEAEANGSADASEAVTEPG